MSKGRIKNYIKGYIIVKVEGLNPEKFINLASKKGITMWDIEKINFTTIQLKMNYYQYKLLRDIVKRTNCRCKIIKKYGMNFLFYKMGKRKYFVFGLIIFISFIIYLSSFVWSIEIKGNKNIDSSRIYSAVSNAGLKKGAPKYKLNLRDIENSVQKEIDEISVINIKFAGTKAKIEIVERTMPPKVDDNKPANIVAVKEGVILKIVSYKGEPSVHNGDIVKKDQVLISGILTNNQNAALGFVHAKGIVTAKTWYENITEIPIDYKYDERTGKVKKVIYYQIGKKKIYIKNDNIDFKKYDKIEEKRYVKVFGYETPIEEITETYSEISQASKKLNYSEALAIAESKAEENVKKQIPKDAKMLERKVERQMGNGRTKVKVLYIMEENIGVAKDIK